MGRALLVLHGDADRAKATHWVNRAPLGTRIEFKASKRSLPQNDRLWAMLTDVAAHQKAQGRDYTTEEWKLLFMHAWGREVRFLPGLDNKSVVPIGQSSSDLSKEEMTDLIEFIFAWGAEKGVTFNEPTEATPSADVAGSGDQPSPDDHAADQSTPVEEAGADQVERQAPASIDLDPDERALLLRVYRSMAECVGPSFDDYDRAFLIFDEPLAHARETVVTKAKLIMKSLRYCCGETPARTKLAAIPYLAGVIGAEESELAS